MFSQRSELRLRRSSAFRAYACCGSPGMFAVTARAESQSGCRGLFASEFSSASVCAVWRGCRKESAERTSPHVRILQAHPPGRAERSLPREAGGHAAARVRYTPNQRNPWLERHKLSTRLEEMEAERAVPASAGAPPAARPEQARLRASFALFVAESARARRGERLSWSEGAERPTVLVSGHPGEARTGGVDAAGRLAPGCIAPHASVRDSWDVLGMQGTGSPAKRVRPELTDGATVHRACPVP